MTEDQLARIVGRAVLAHADAIAERVVARLRDEGQTPTRQMLLSVNEAAELLGISADALRKRIDRKQFPMTAVKRTGRAVQIHRDRLLAAIDPAHYRGRRAR